MRRIRVATCVLWAAACVVVGCGYHSARAPGSGASGWCVEPGDAPAAHPQASTALVFGARDALARRGLLSPCSEGHTLLVEVVHVRLDTEGLVSGDGAATARATRVSVSASAHDVGSDTRFVVTEHYVVATGASPLEQEHAVGAGVVAAARRAGDALVLRRLGEPVPGPSSP